MANAHKKAPWQNQEAFFMPSCPRLRKSLGAGGLFRFFFPGPDPSLRDGMLAENFWPAWLTYPHRRNQPPKPGTGSPSGQGQADAEKPLTE
jgi:hypothetical protein